MATASSSGAARVRRLAQGHLHTPLGGVGVRTSDLPVTIQPVSHPLCLSPRRAVGPEQLPPAGPGPAAPRGALHGGGPRPRVVRPQQQDLRGAAGGHEGGGGSPGAGSGALTGNYGLGTGGGARGQGPETRDQGPEGRGQGPGLRVASTHTLGPDSTPQHSKQPAVQ